MNILNARQFNESIKIQPVTKRRLAEHGMPSSIGSTVRIGDAVWAATNSNLIEPTLKPMKDFFVEHNEERGTIVYYTFSGALKSVPEGWRIPTLVDVRKLRTICNDSSLALMSEHDGGHDTYGFGAQTVGYYKNNKWQFDDTEFCYWCLDEQTSQPHIFYGERMGKYIQVKRVPNNNVFAYTLRLIKE